jgi:hypothetical protein
MPIASMPDEQCSSRRGRLQAQGGRSCTVAGRLANGVRSIATDVGGGLSVSFAVVGLLLVLTAGAAIDTARWLHARSETMLAVDAAVLAGGRLLQIGEPQEAAVAVAAESYRRGTQKRMLLESDSINFAVIDGGAGVAARGAAFIATPFLSIVGVHSLPLVDMTGDLFAAAKLTVGDNARASLEIALVLDVSDVMRGEPLASIKAAVRNFIDIVVWQDQSRFTSKVALVPFAGDVRLPAGLLAAARDPAMPATVRGEPWSCGGPFGGACVDIYYRRSCVVERFGLDRFTDAAPGAGRYITPLYTTFNRNCSTPAASPVMPLSSDRDAIAAGIDGLATGAGRGTQIGTAWGWYVLSPHWASVMPDGSAAESYAAAGLRKIAILLFGGAANVGYSASGVVAGTAGAPLASEAANGPPSGQVLSMCEGMKQSGIEIYAIGFGPGIDATAADLVRGCATGADQARFAGDGGQLRSVFRDIGMEIAMLYLSN